MNPKPALSRPRVVLSLAWRCPSASCQRPLPMGVTIRSGQVWLRCEACRSRTLAIALTPGATGHELAAIVGSELASEAIRAYLPIAAEFEDEQCLPLRLVAWDAPGPAFLFLGPVLGAVMHSHQHAPLATVLHGLGLTREAA